MIFNMIGGSKNGSGSFPEFTYSGIYTLIDDGVLDDGTQNWRLKLLTSGKLNFSNFGSGAGVLDVFCVGGGGGSLSGRGAGGGGYTTTSVIPSLQKNTDYDVVVGAGGTGTDGGTTSFANVTASGGVCPTGRGGGAGGSGGGASGFTSSASYGGGGGSGGTDGNDGSPAYVETTLTAGGKGQGTTTREFGESDGTLYSDGGNGGTRNTAKNSGGLAGQSGTSDAPDNTGCGGGGNITSSGGSGIVVIRNHREVSV